MIRPPGEGARAALALAVLALGLGAPGAAARGYLGLSAVDLPQGEAPRRPDGTPVPAGAVRIVLVAAHSPGEAAGFEVGDVVLTVDGRRLGAADERPSVAFRRLSGEGAVGDTLRFEVLRTSPVLSVSRSGEPVERPRVAIARLEDEIASLGEGDSLDVSVRRRSRIERLTARLGLHPHDRPPVRPAPSRSPRAPTDLERFAGAVLAARGLGPDTEDLFARLAVLGEGDDGFRTDAARSVLRDPWAIEAVSAELSSSLGPPGGEGTLAGRIQAAARFGGRGVERETWPPLPLEGDAEAQARALARLVEETAALVQRAFADLSPQEMAGAAMLWRGLSPALDEGIYLHADDDAARRLGNLALLDLAARVDLAALDEAAASWARLTDPDWLAALRRALTRHPKRDAAEIARVETPHGDVVLCGRARNVHRDGAPAVLVDLGGDDVHASAAGAALGPERPVSALIDFAGDDAYEATDDGAQGAGILGVGILLDLEGDDRYLAPAWAQGVGVLGMGALIDTAGDDTYRARRLAQGVGLWGSGWLVDGRGDDLYEARAYAQGLGLPGGVGVVHDRLGDDRYFAKGGRPTGYGTRGVYDAWSQGTGLGFRGLQSGGIGALLDDAGGDRREAGNFSQGGGYYFGWGLLHDRGRADDVHVGSRYAQGYAAHQALGTFLDDGGDDTYLTRHGVIAGLAWDECVTLFRDRGGDDTYRAGFFSLGASAHNGFSLFVDDGGADTYEGASPARAGGNEYHGGTSLSLFLDLGAGGDSYPGDEAAPRLRVRGEHGIFADLPGPLARHVTRRALARLSSPD